MLRTGFLGLLALTLAGCGGEGTSVSPNTAIPVYSVKGTVKFKDGKVVTEGLVEFVSQAEVTKGRSSTAKVKPDGSYELETFDKGKGAFAGPSLARITPLIHGSGPAVDDEGNPIEGKVEKKAASSIPAKYNDYKTSGLSFTIEKKENVIDIVLEADASDIKGKVEKTSEKGKE
ncbi:MAG: hypothetical protein EXR99_10990 [Gemmataceae bacterium]|nr:hypothetical protein [Gemmataceae bacterium]